MIENIHSNKIIIKRYLTLAVLGLKNRVCRQCSDSAEVVPTLQAYFLLPVLGTFVQCTLLRDLNTAYFRKIMTYKSIFLLFTAIMSNRQKYHCYMYSEQATDNMPAVSYVITVSHLIAYATVSECTGLTSFISNL